MRSDAARIKAVAEGHAPLEHRGTRAVQRLVEFSPATGGLALWVRHHDLRPDEKGPPIATDGNTLRYGPGFEAFDLPLQAGMIAHAVLHVALRHPQRYLALRSLLGDVDLRLFNTCADAIVNSTLSHLTWLRLPERVVMLERLLADTLDIDQPVEKSLLEWDVERLYRAIDDRRTPDRSSGRRQTGNARTALAQSGASAAHEADSPADQDGRRSDGPRSARARALGAGTPVDLIPDAANPELPEAAADQIREWGERVLRAHASDGVHSMLRTLIADLPRTRTPWEQVLRAQLARSLSPKPAPSWSRPSRSYIANQGRCGPNRRMPWEPGASGTRPVPRLALMVDVSGSIEDGLMARFAREIEAITRRLEADMLLVIGDDQVRRVERFAPGRTDLRNIEFNGGGGTDFTPLLEEADRYRPDIGVVLTDLEGPARFKPRWPVIWAVPEAHAATVQPFGRKLPLI
jgi:predicted metal-dependent peptidase